MMNVLDGCLKHSIPEIFLASSSEVYNQPTVIPTPENVPLVIADPKNPRLKTELMNIAAPNSAAVPPTSQQTHEQTARALASRRILGYSGAFPGGWRGPA